MFGVLAGRRERGGLVFVVAADDRRGAGDDGEHEQHDSHAEEAYGATAGGCSRVSCAFISVA